MERLSFFRKCIFLLFSSLHALVFAQVKTDENTYDYIVVGSGPGGGPLAANLAKANYSVLLLEAGSNQTSSLEIQVPPFLGLVESDPLMRWDFFVKYHSSEALTNKFIHLVWKTPEGKFYVGPDGAPKGSEKLGVYYPRAGTLGGCSTHNALASALPSDRDWSIVVELTGDTSWEPANMRKYFIRIDHNDDLPVGTPGHGFTGYLDQRVTDPAQLVENTQHAYMVRQAATLMGQNVTNLTALVTFDLNNASPNRDQQVGIGGFPTHRDKLGRRVTSAKPVQAVFDAVDKNGKKLYRLSVKTESLVTKVLFDNTRAYGDNPRAIGVEYLAGESMYSADPRYNSSIKGTKKQAFARKEVIVSGGTFNSPQILKLSGIGPRAELEKFKIPVVVDLPGVGTNLQDNYEIGIIATASEDFVSTGAACTFGADGDPCLSLWQKGQGPYTYGFLDSLMYKTSKSVFGERDLFMWTSTGAFRGFWPSDIVNTLPVDPPSTFDFSMAKMHSQSRLGTVLLRSNDPRDTPDINFRFFEDEHGDEDISAMEEGVNFGRKVYASIAAPIGPFTENTPCNGTASCDTKEFIREQAWSHHASGSCAIGADDDPMAVLDSNFRVRGTDGLRVVDASIFPRSPGGFPVVPTFVVSEKAFDAILQDA